MVILGLGSNVGDREQNLRDCIKLLSEFIEFKYISSCHESSAMLPENASESWDMPFLNMVAAGTVTLPPMDLLARCKAIEVRLGRPADHPRWSPRTIDIDLLDHNGMVMQEAALTLPHPGIAERRFVLEPLAEIFPGWKHPVTGLTAREMLNL